MPETHGRMDRHTHTWGDGARQTETETKTWGDPGTRDARASGGTTEADGHSGRDRGRQTLGETSRDVWGDGKGEDRRDGGAGQAGAGGLEGG